jgi:hypothetical protein
MMNGPRTNQIGIAHDLAARPEAIFAGCGFLEVICDRRQRKFFPRLRVPDDNAVPLVGRHDDAMHLAVTDHGVRVFFEVGDSDEDVFADQGSSRIVVEFGLPVRHPVISFGDFMQRSLKIPRVQG